MNRSSIVLLLAAVVLAGLALLLANPFQDAVRVDNPESAELFGAGDVLSADRVEIRTAGSPLIQLSQGAEGWAVASRDGFPADTAAVGSLLRAVALARSTGPVSTNPENRAKFQVDSTGVEVGVWRGEQKLAGFIVGKGGRDFTTSYVLPDGDDAVHVVRGLNRNLFSRPRGFRDVAVMRFSPDRVQGVVLTGTEGGWELGRTDSLWTLSREGEEPAVAAAAAVDDLLRNLGRLDADGLAERPDTLNTGLENPETVITVRLDDGSERALWIGNDNGRGQRFAVRPGRRVAYLLGEWRVTRVVRKYEDLAGQP